MQIQNIQAVKKDGDNKPERPAIMELLYTTLMTSISESHNTMRTLAERSSGTSRQEADVANTLSATNIKPVETHQHAVTTKVGFWEHFAFWNADAYKSNHVKYEDDLTRLNADQMSNTAVMNERAVAQGRMTRLQQQDDINASSLQTVTALANGTMQLTNEINTYQRKMTKKAILDPDKSD